MKDNIGGRCDTCNANVGPPCWLHKAVPTLADMGVDDKDGLWLLCDTCHNYLLLQNVEAWITHYMKIAARQDRTPKSLSAHRVLRAALIFRYEAAMERFDQGERRGLIIAH